MYEIRYAIQTQLVTQGNLPKSHKAAFCGDLRSTHTLLTFLMPERRTSDWPKMRCNDNAERQAGRSYRTETTCANFGHDSAWSKPEGVVASTSYTTLGSGFLQSFLGIASDRTRTTLSRHDSSLRLSHCFKFIVTSRFSLFSFSKHNIRIPTRHSIRKLRTALFHHLP